MQQNFKQSSRTMRFNPQILNMCKQSQTLFNMYRSSTMDRVSPAMRLNVHKRRAHTVIVVDVDTTCYYCVIHSSQGSFVQHSKYCCHFSRLIWSFVLIQTYLFDNSLKRTQVAELLPRNKKHGLVPLAPIT